METSTLFIIILIIIIGQYLFDTTLSILNNKNRNAPIPKSLQDLYSKEEYEKSQNYGKENNTIGIISNTFSTLITVILFYTGAFGALDQWIGQYTTHYILQPLLFLGVLGMGSSLLGIPFSYYATFVIEEKYQFNRSTKKTFILDAIKGLLLSGLFIGGILSQIILLYHTIGENFYIFAFIVIVGFSLIMTFFYSSIIVPLFNKQTPLEEGELKQGIMDFAKKAEFPIKEIYVMDGSKRSAKANAYFTGFGKRKRIVLFDTLIDQLDQEEIIAVLAHEVGHAKKRHVIQSMIFSWIQTFVILYIFSLILNQPTSSHVMGSSQHTFELSLLLFSFLLSPVTEVLSAISSIFSRKNEYEADNFVKKYKLKDAIISGLKKISKNSLSNLTPHPWVVACTYSHPTLEQRIDNLNQKD
ncbi:M48 family metallopeptidase [Halosquirtibacter laminarini]|uniref:M48 family metallopeptidase n=1 Tax=Halosquirtibacter laminarini TaxID=3374600 RepID=A0AC61NJH2_9BACT|nr:M48 family metallopeptidase [Prolixibacteraceae bacterium]